MPSTVRAVLAACLAVCGSATPACEATDPTCAALALDEEGPGEELHLLQQTANLQLSRALLGAKAAEGGTLPNLCGGGGEGGDGPSCDEVAMLQQSSVVQAGRGLTQKLLAAQEEPARVAKAGVVDVALVGEGAEVFEPKAADMKKDQASLAAAPIAAVAAVEQAADAGKVEAAHAGKVEATASSIAVEPRVAEAQAAEKATEAKAAASVAAQTKKAAAAPQSEHEHESVAMKILEADGFLQKVKDLAVRFVYPKARDGLLDGKQLFSNYCVAFLFVSGTWTYVWFYFIRPKEEEEIDARFKGGM